MQQQNSTKSEEYEVYKTRISKNSDKAVRFKSKFLNS